MKKKYTADDIQTLSTAEVIRIRPQLYFDKCFREKSLDSLPFEVLCHAFDEYFDGACTKIEISICIDSFTVKYNAGISLESTKDDFSKAELIMTRIFACRNEKKHLAVGEEFCSLGMATINFAAQRCQLATVCNNKKGIFIFENGETVSRIIEEVKGEKDCTKIFVEPNKSVFKGLAFTFDGINEKAREVNSKLAGLQIIIHNNIQVH